MPTRRPINKVVPVNPAEHVLCVVILRFESLVQGTYQTDIDRSLILLEY